MIIQKKMVFWNSAGPWSNKAFFCLSWAMAQLNYPRLSILHFSLFYWACKTKLHEARLSRDPIKLKLRSDRDSSPRFTIHYYSWIIICMVLFMNNTFHLYIFRYFPCYSSYIFHVLARENKDFYLSNTKTTFKFIFYTIYLLVKL